MTARLGKRQRAYLEAMVNDTCDAASSAEERLLKSLVKKGMMTQRPLWLAKFDLTPEGEAIRDAAQTCPGCGARLLPLSTCEICEEKEGQ